MAEKSERQLIPWQYLVAIVGGILAVAVGSSRGTDYLGPMMTSAVQSRSAEPPASPPPPNCPAIDTEHERELIKARYATKEDVTKLGTKMDIVNERIRVMSERLDEFTNTYKATRRRAHAAVFN